MPLFRKKPVVIEARQFFNDNTTWEVLRWINEYKKLDYSKWHEDTLTIPTLEGDHKAAAGDWIIRGVKNEFYPCKADIFAMTYEPADPA